MHPEPTPAVKRALAAANCWHRGNASDAVGPVELLLGLLAEPECRAATILDEIGIDATDICQQWPDLKAARRLLGTDRPWSGEFRSLLARAQSWLAEYSDTEPLATEHLLLGLLSGQNDVAQWLTDSGLEFAALETTICKLYGHSNEPLEIDDEMPDEAPVVATENERNPAMSEVAQQDETLEPPCPQPPVEQHLPHDDIAVLRVLDAAANRAAEALRVVDDYVRFVLDDRHLTEQFKNLRHDLATAMSRLPVDSLLAARETLRDVGVEITTTTEQQRHDLNAVVTANIHRAQQALRTLEEYGKLLDPALGAAIETLRYRSYTLHRALHTTSSSMARLADARLYVLIDGCSSERECASHVKSLIAAGVDVIQLRDKQLDDRQLLERARLLRELTHDTKALLIINDRPDLARLAGADGVHLGQEELSVKDARTIVGPTALVGVSTHNIEQARQAVLDGANYIGVGPTFPSNTKQFDNFTGVELLRAVAAEIRLPAFAIGGIDLTNVDQVLAAGFCRIAVTGAIAASNDPASVAQALVDKLAASTSL